MYIPKNRYTENQNMKAILRTEKLCKSFSNEGLQQHVIKNLDLEIMEGDFTIIMGSSGSGKSTLLYALSGMDKPTLGKVFFGDEDISEYSNDELALFRRKHCGFVFQSIYLLDNMNVFDNIMTGALVARKNSPELVAGVKELLKKVGIGENLWNKYPNQLSGGECQRVGIVRAVVNKPRILFADEPTGALNSQNTLNVLDILSDLNAKGQSIVMVTHTVKAAERGTRIIYLADGVISDECDLGPYMGDYKDEKNPNQEKAIARHKKLKDFLQDMGW